MYEYMHVYIYMYSIEIMCVYTWIQTKKVVPGNLFTRKIVYADRFQRSSKRRRQYRSSPVSPHHITPSCLDTYIYTLYTSCIPYEIFSVCVQYTEYYALHSIYLHMYMYICIYIY